ncbi:MAG TPA: hypothetical protein VJS68_02675 [Thermoplasmata archaeon]|nr:hypothetical protein [Thermoplasmata archaeon]
MRLGPFPNATEALKFLLWATAAFVLASIATPLVAVPVLSSGLFLSVYHPEGVGLDRRFWTWCRFRFRSGAAAPGAAGSGERPFSTRFLDGKGLAVASAQGIPLRFLPPARQREVYDAFRQLLSGLEGEALFHAVTEPVPARRYLPRRRVSGGAESFARDGYSELLRQLLRRRRRRTVLLALVGGPGSSPAVTAGLDGRIASVMALLDSIDVPTTRLRGGELRRALRRWSLG